MISFLSISRLLSNSTARILSTALRAACSVLMAVILIMPAGHAVASPTEAVIGVGVSLSPLGVDVSAPAEVPAGKTFRIKVSFTNLSDAGIRKAVAAIHLPDHLTLAGGKAEVKLGTIPAHRGKTADWEVKGVTEGRHFIVVSAAGEWGGVVVTGKREVVLTVTAASRTRWWERILQIISR